MYLQSLWQNLIEYLNKGTNLVQFDDMWMVQLFHDVHLPVDLFQIHRIELSLINDFDRHLK
jgi:hypothetical protein